METLLNFSIALTASIVTAFVTVHLSLKKFYSERWWDRKVQSYTNLFEALYNLKNYSDLKYDESIGERLFTEDDSKRLGEQWRTSKGEVDKAIEIGSFTISEDSIDCLNRFTNHQRIPYESGMIHELAEEESKILSEYIAELKILASKDLKRK